MNRSVAKLIVGFGVGFGMLVIVSIAGHQSGFIGSLAWLAAWPGFAAAIYFAEGQETASAKTWGLAALFMPFIIPAVWSAQRLVDGPLSQLVDELGEPEEGRPSQSHEDARGYSEDVDDVPLDGDRASDSRDSHHDDDETDESYDPLEDEGVSVLDREELAPMLQYLVEEYPETEEFANAVWTYVRHVRFSELDVIRREGIIDEWIEENKDRDEHFKEWAEELEQRHQDLEEKREHLSQGGQRPHEVLGVERDADQETIKRAYRRLSKDYHPDRLGALPAWVQEEGNARMRRVNWAWEKMKHKQATVENAAEAV